jgi:hypothetical protein
MGMKAKVTSIEDGGTSNLLRVHHERPGEKEGVSDAANDLRALEAEYAGRTSQIQS